MENNYEKYIKVEDEIYKNIQITIPKDKNCGNEQLNKGLDWLSEGTTSLLDFGCGNGSLLFYSAIRGVEKLLGIDLSYEGIQLARKRANLMNIGEYNFIQGSIAELEQFQAESMDAVILSNIIDNLRPEDAIKLLEEVKRLLRKQGKVFIKLNPYLLEEQIIKLEIQVIDDKLLDDGLLLWNQKTEEWRELLERYFVEKDFIDIYFPEHDQYNRLFLMENK